MRRWSTTVGLAASFMLLPTLGESAHARPDGIHVCCDQPPIGSRPSAPDDRREHLAKPRHFDHKHMRLDFFIADMDQPNIDATQTLTLAPIGEVRSAIELDARGMKITGVSVDGQAAKFEHDGRTLRISLAVPAGMGSDLRVVTAYELHDPALGLIWTPRSTAWLTRPPQIHTQGQPETNSYWFPCHDSPNERVTTELVATVPAGFTVSSNGRLVSHENKVLAVDNDTGGSDLKGYERWHWLQDQPHVYYLVTMVVGKFDVVDVAPADDKDWTLPLPVYAPIGRGGDVPGTYGRTGEMVRVFEQVTGRAYPWDRYAQLIVWNFGSGGMENTSATTMYDTAIIPRESLIDHDLEGLISHELAHQWFGDLITCDSWDHVWLNEGWATYMTALWYERRAPRASDPPGASGLDGYLSYVLANVDDLIEKDKVDAPTAVGLTSNFYQHPWETFRRPSNPYSKGSTLLHMLRQKMGDEAFFRATRRYVARHEFQTVTTRDFQAMCEEACGSSLEPFCGQWATRPGLPKIEMTASWDAARRVLTLAARQTQKIDAANPAFEVSLPVWLKLPTSGETWRTMILAMTGEEAAVEVSLDSEPEMIAVNPMLEVLADVQVTQTSARWVRQIAQGPTLVARVHAARALGKERGDAGAQALRRVALDKDEPTRLRTEAVKALAKRGLVSELQGMASSNIDRWEVREEVMKSLAEGASAKDVKLDSGQVALAARTIAGWAVKDKSVKVRAAAIKGLGTMKAAEHFDIVREALRTNSHEDDLRQAALETLASYDTPEGLKLASELTRPGLLTRTRAAAVIAVGKLGKHDRDAAFTLASSLLEDREIRVKRGAGEALVEMHEARGIEAIERWAEAHRPEEFQYLAGTWIKDIRKKMDGAGK